MSYEQNPYYHPEAMNLETIGEIEFSDGDYNFDTRVFWKELSTNKVYTARDSGCSCPTPFEDYDTIESLTLVQNSDFQMYVDEYRQDIYKYSVTKQDEAQDLIIKVFRLV